MTRLANSLLLLLAVGCTDDTTTGDSGVVAADCTPSGVVCTVSGTGSPGSNENESSPTLSPLYAPMDVAIGPRGTTCESG